MVIINYDTTYPFLEMVNRPSFKVAISGIPKQKSEVAASPVPSPGPKRGQKLEFVPTASKRGAESKAAHKWARWLHNPCRLGGPNRFKAGGRIKRGPQVCKVAT